MRISMSEHEAARVLKALRHAVRVSSTCDLCNVDLTRVADRIAKELGEPSSAILDAQKKHRITISQGA